MQIGVRYFSAIGMWGLMWSAFLFGCSTSAINPGENPFLGSDDSDTGTDTGSDSESDSITDSDSEPVSCLLEDPCTMFGTCLVADGRKYCDCDAGWDGEVCDICAPGWHLQNGYCVLDQQCLPTSCAYREVVDGCEVVAGTVVCTCEGNWDASTHCLECLPGYHEMDGECEADVYCVGEYPCEHGGVCSDEEGVIECDCSFAGSLFLGTDNWQGEYCEICPEGYYEDGDDCLPREQCDLDTCGDHGTCVETVEGPVDCVCAPGWTGDICDACANGYHADSGGECVPDEVCESTTCGDGDCMEDADGGVTCICPPGSHLDATTFCAECESGYHTADGACVLNDMLCELENLCTEKGTCVYEDGVKRCDCQPLYTGDYCEMCAVGYQDADDNGECLPSCETAEANGLDCGDWGACSDDTGTAVCDCAGNWSGALCDVCPFGFHVEGGDCVENDSCDPDFCNGHGTCAVPPETGLAECDCDEGWMDDSFGNVCSVCASGYQNTYVPNDCLPTCATAVANGLDCGDHGDCALNVTTGIAYCACDTGWSGDGCSVCETGYHASGGSCVLNDPSCAESNPCGTFGTCTYLDGVKSCTCATLYTGATCEECVSGYQDTNSDGICRPTCATAVFNGLDCGDYGTCDVGLIDGLAYCECATGYAGSDCSVCDTGYHLDAGVCVEDDVCADATGPCVNGMCSVVGGVMECTCDLGYTEDGDGYCTLCETGYHDNGGVCVVDEQCQVNSCNGNGTCSIVDGVIKCTCYTGFTAASYCANCTTGFHPSGGTCVLNEVCGTHACNDHGDCDDSTYEVVCTCYDGWDGELCTECALGYHLDGGECVLNESCIMSSCSFNGICDDTGGVVVCDCDTGYDGDYCEVCDIGYHINYLTGECVVNDTCQEVGDGSVDCSYQGSCDDSTGLVICTCDDGYAGDDCSICDNGYHMDGAVCTEDVVCSPSSCAHGGSCDDSGGAVVCTCTGEWDPDTHCTTCVTGFHEISGSCVADEVCDANSCNGHGTCSIVGGVVDCVCADGYSGDYCDSCDVSGGYSACGSVCCDVGETCYNNACVTPLTCDDLDTDNFTECGPTAFDDGAGGTIDCGDCGTKGTCVGGVCDCNDNYGVLDGGHECVYACDPLNRYLPTEGCCMGDWVVYCSQGEIATTYCGDNDSPYHTCGWLTSSTIFSCYNAVPPVEYNATCPSNLVVDTTIPICEEDVYEENDDEDNAYELIVGESISATQCSGDEDIYKVYLVDSQTVEISVQFVHSVINLNVGIWYSSITPSTYETMVYYLYSSSSTNNIETTILTAGQEYPYYSGVYTGEGYYYITIHLIEGTSGGYVLTVDNI